MQPLAFFGGEPIRKKPWPRYPQFGEREIEAAARVVRSGNLCAQFGNEVEHFEREFAAYLGVKHAVAVANGTCALHVALAALGIGRDDETIVPAYTFIATGTAVLMQNAVPLFADIEPKVQGIDLESARKLVSKRTKAIMVVAVNGYPPDMNAVMRFAREHRLAVIEDAAHAHGAEYQGRKIGSIGDLGCFSFHQKKNLSLGEGGMITGHDDAIAESCRQIRSFGANARLAYNYRMTELHAAIGRVRLKDLDTHNEIRVRNAERLHCQLEGVRGIRTQRPLPDTNGVYYNFILRYDSDDLGVPREKFLKALNAEGIPATSLYFPIYRHRSFRDAAPDRQRQNRQEGACPLAEAHCDRCSIELKIHPPASLADMDDAAAALRKVIERIADLKQSSQITSSRRMPPLSKPLPKGVRRV